MASIIANKGLSEFTKNCAIVQSDPHFYLGQDGICWLWIVVPRKELVTLANAMMNGLKRVISIALIFSIKSNIWGLANALVINTILVRISMYCGVRFGDLSGVLGEGSKYQLMNSTP